MRFVFEDCDLDTQRMELRVNGVAVSVEPQVLDVLMLLVRQRDRVVPKEELMDAVWHHRFVAESSLTSRIKSARRAIGDDGHAQRLIRTVHGRGYQFIGDVHVAESARTVRTEGPAPVPLPATRTIGRARDIEHVTELLGTARIVTLLGPGGVGKTRLAVEVSLRFAPTEACFVDLTKVRDAGLVPGLIVRELGIHSGAGIDSSHVLAEAVRDSPRLLVLDNFEHVIDAAQVVAAMVRWSPDVRILVTSRARLQIAGEHIVDVAPLSVDYSDAAETSTPDAVALFTQAASAIDPGFHLGTNLADVISICRTLDGLPLAVELAAGHVRTLPPTLLRARLGPQLRSADAAARDLPSRQQTIPAMIDWSLQLLTDRERRLFAWLGVFSVPAPLEAIERVCGVSGSDQVLDSLSRLVDQSMVRRVSGPAGEPRFTLLELLRERARGLLTETGESYAAAAAHAAYVADLCDDIEERKWTDLSGRWIESIDELLSEIRTAHAWAHMHDPRLSARITASLGSFWLREGHHEEARRWVDAALADTGRLDPLLVARLHLAAGLVEFSHDQVAARAHQETAIAALRTLDHDRYLAYALAADAGTYIGAKDDYRVAIALCDEGIALARKVGERPLIAQALNIKGELARVQGHDDVALEVYAEGRELAAAADDRAHLGLFVANLAYLAEHRGEHAEARRLACQSIRISRDLGRRMMVAWSVSQLAGPEFGLGRPERAARLVGASDQALRVMGVNRQPGDIPEFTRVVSRLQEDLGSETFRRLHAEGSRMSLDDAAALALGEPGEWS